ncbi:uncharacterized protein LOC113238353 [Hyposmocoma kahamanoa]|uniref:uncharacterized protein LOC113238353 n=1 Tax=Hyposmocoma kahamanoa TaxID=1477025 RepID=UPI000E6D905D|nr:uncharacterized protein LOC113238353 [Hyposmocoma kahamanoa]
MALYGSPIWVEALTAQLKSFLRRPQRVIVVRVIRGYRTVSWTAATLLTDDPPWELQAEVLVEAHRYCVTMRSRRESPDAEETRRIRKVDQGSGPGRVVPKMGGGLGVSNRWISDRGGHPPPPSPLG